MPAIFNFPIASLGCIRKEWIMVRGMSISLHAFGRFITVIVAFVALGACLVLAQTSTGNILGTVRDTSGALVPGVSITIKHTESGLTRTVVSSENGGFNGPLLPVVGYEV